MGDTVRAGSYIAIALTVVTLAIATGGWQAVAAGSDTAYTVANYPVQATADNAVAAK